jgi:hypothetical protein
MVQVLEIEFFEYSPPLWASANPNEPKTEARNK